jgi:hypothetical protein
MRKREREGGSVYEKEILREILTRKDTRGRENEREILIKIERKRERKCETQ